MRTALFTRSPVRLFDLWAWPTEDGTPPAVEAVVPEVATQVLRDEVFVAALGQGDGP